MAELDAMFGDSDSDDSDSNDKDDSQQQQAQAHAQAQAMPEAARSMANAVFIETMRLKGRMIENQFLYNYASAATQGAKAIQKHIGILVPPSPPTPFQTAFLQSLLAAFKRGNLQVDVQQITEDNQRSSLTSPYRFDVAIAVELLSSAEAVEVLAAASSSSFSSSSAFDSYLVPGGSLIGFIESPSSSSSSSFCYKIFPASNWITDKAAIKPVENGWMQGAESTSSSTSTSCSMLTIKKRAVHCNTGGAIYWFEGAGEGGEQTGKGGTQLSKRIRHERRLLEEISVTLSVDERLDILLHIAS
jgi:hypothetical protein